MSTENKGKLLDQVRRKMRLLHYSIHTERSYCDWIRRYAQYHRMRCREDLSGGERKIEAFLTHLAVDQKVAPSTQNQAMNALVFLYKVVLEQPLDQTIDAIRATPRASLPVVMTREEVGRVLALMEGTPQLIVKLLYGSGLRIMEAVRLRVKDVDFDLKEVLVRAGKGDKDRVTTFAAKLIPLWQAQSQFRNPFTPAGHGYPDDSGAVGPPGCLHHDDLYAHFAAGWTRVFPVRWMICHSKPFTGRRL